MTHEETGAWPLLAAHRQVSSATTSSPHATLWARHSSAMTSSPLLPAAAAASSCSRSCRGHAARRTSRTAARAASARATSTTSTALRRRRRATRGDWPANHRVLQGTALPSTSCAPPPRARRVFPASHSDFHLPRPPPPPDYFHAPASGGRRTWDGGAGSRCGGIQRSRWRWLRTARASNGWRRSASRPSRRSRPDSRPCCRNTRMYRCATENATHWRIPPPRAGCLPVLSCTRWMSTAAARTHTNTALF